ncbi:MAG TPA: 2-amino-4-hydroxy-6-hydroxymethyldihydropteridine diphosphokinase [Alphaproteobacteria bacterium]|nr:2-amino-4-hydroxy-6-hydroxymethyldihydropteridine diphosphokinase [Alphaproteobacteria bacterium]HIK87723.1 2-amino-4-hydroxy-6-hydroxymethyldihydropteridine diphosphokinase [Alphaproteobacteria bacterium]
MKHKNNNVIISIGSNLNGHMNTSKKILNIVFYYLGKQDLRVRKASRIYISKPFPSGLGPVFYNRVVMIKSNINPLEILNRLKRIERVFSKRSKVINSPRVLDLDILDYKGKVIDYKNYLNLPHPRMNNRDFILKPMYDICPNWINPSTGETIESLLYNYKKSNISVAKVI